MFEPTLLSQSQVYRCMDTISTSTFYMMVANAVLRREPLSIVRMGDGEKLLMDYLEGLPASTRDVEDDDWMGRLGCLGIDKCDLHDRIKLAANECTWFAPSISGIIREDFELYNRFRSRPRYVDNFWCNAWTEEMKINLYKAAGHILFIHRNPNSYAALADRAHELLGVKTSYIQMDNWRQSEDVIAQAYEVDAPLVLFSAGPASKYIGHRIATRGRISKVSLDLGNSSDLFLLYETWQQNLKQKELQNV